MKSELSRRQSRRATTTQIIVLDETSGRRTLHSMPPSPPHMPLSVQLRLHKGMNSKADAARMSLAFIIDHVRLLPVEEQFLITLPELGTATPTQFLLLLELSLTGDGPFALGLADLFDVLSENQSSQLQLAYVPANGNLPLRLSFKNIYAVLLGDRSFPFNGYLEMGLMLRKHLPRAAPLRLGMLHHIGTPGLVMLGEPTTSE